MTKLFQKILSLTLTLLTIVSLTTGVLAVEGDSYLDMGTEEFTFRNVDDKYTTSDLFNNFKNVMPGDKLAQTIILTNNSDADFLSLTLYGVDHDEENKLHEAVADTWQNADNSLTHAEILEKMKNYLKLMNIAIYKDHEDSEPLFSGTADTIIDNGIFLGEINKNESLTLYVTLDVDINMDNDYAHKAGEIDWQFSVKGVNKNSLTVMKIWEDNNYPKRPSSVNINLIQTDRGTGKSNVFKTITLRASDNWTYTWSELSDEYTWSVEETNVPDKYTVTYDTATEGVVKIINSYDYNPPYIPWYPTPDPKPDPEPDTPIETEPVETEPEETQPEETEPETNPPETEPETEPPVETPVVRDLTVRKAWAEDKASDRPTSVTVALYEGENEVEKVVLGDWNDWSYTWYDLDCNQQWTVLEVDIPLGYTPTYAADGDTVTITNNAILIQTGQLNWPIPVFGGIGVLLIVGGILLLRKKKEDA